MKTIKNNIKYIIFLATFGLIGGYFVTLYSIQTLNKELLDEVIVQAGSLDLVILVSTIQSLIYTIVFGLFGKTLAKKIGLWREISFKQNENIELILCLLVSGIAFILIDYCIFGQFLAPVKELYLTKPTIECIIASITYGAVTEEILLRLFAMSLIVVIFKRLFKCEENNDKILIISNIISSIIFAALHLPATYLTFGEINILILFRCFLMNGAFGLLFGRLYRKYGIYYAMIAHAGLHIVSKLIWLLFI